MPDAGTRSKAYLAALPAAERAAVLAQMTLVKITEHTIVTAHALSRDLAEIRGRGYALDREETEPDIFCVGAVITNGAGLPIGAISVSLPKYRLGPDSHSAYPELVLTCARRISERVSAHAGPVSE